MEASRELADEAYLCLLYFLLLLEEIKIQGSYVGAMQWRRRAFESREVCSSGIIRFVTGGGPEWKLRKRNSG